MTSDNLQAGPEMNDLVAQNVMGWDKIDENLWMYEFEPGRGARMYTGKGPVLMNVVWWNPSEDIKAAWEVEERIKELGAEGAYMTALNLVVAYDAVKDGSTWSSFLQTHATPLQRCRAALEAIPH